MKRPFMMGRRLHAASVSGAALACAVAITLSGCGSVVESESAPQEASAASSSAPSAAEEETSSFRPLPGWKNCLDAPVVRPQVVEMNCGRAGTIRALRWLGWSRTRAEGRGIFTPAECAEQQQRKCAERVQLVLSQPVQTAEGPAFSQIDLKQ